MRAFVLTIVRALRKGIPAKDAGAACEYLGTMPQATSQADHGLRRQLSLRDLVNSQVVCVVGATWVGVAAGLGRAETLMWIGAMVLFYLPMAASVIGLNRAMPLEGGLYVWAHRAFGDLGGFLTAWNIWFYGVAVTAAIFYQIPTDLSFLIGPRVAWLPESHSAALIIVAAVVVLLTLAELRGLEIGKWIHNAGGVAMNDRVCGAGLPGSVGIAAGCAGSLDVAGAGDTTARSQDAGVVWTDAVWCVVRA